jgi:Glycosyl transferase 4-like domain
MTDKVAVLVSLNFPPSQIASVHRGRHLAKHLRTFGWRPIVVTVDERFHKEPIDPALGRLVPPFVDVHRVKAVPLWVTRAIGLGDLSVRSIYHVAQKLDQVITEANPSVVLFTGWPFYHMLLAQRIKRRFDVPVVLDFQDPWVSRWGAQQPALSKAGLSYWVATRLEPRAIRAASFITSVSDVQNAEMAGRYPWIDPSRMAGIPIGGDPDDFEYLREIGVQQPGNVLDPTRINLSFVGTFMPRSGPLVRLVLRALDRLRRDEPSVGSLVRLNFIGTSNQPNGHLNYQVEPIAREIGVAAAVHEVPQRLPYLDALAVLVRSEGVLLIGSDEPHYSASKIYPALMSGRPFLSLFHKASSAHSILSSIGGGLAHAFEARTDMEGLVSELARSLHRISVEREKLGHADPVAYAPFEAREITARFVAIFEKVVRRE